MTVASTTGLAALMAAALLALPALAETVPSIPDYLFRAPEQQWVTGASLGQPGDACVPERCEAGYHSGDLVLSVTRSPGAIRAVAGVRGCSAVSWHLIQPSSLAGLTPADQYRVIARAAQSAARLARSRCSPGVSDLIDTGSLYVIVPPHGWGS